MKITTTFFHSVGGHEIVFEIEPEAAELARWISDYFESQAELGTKFSDGQTIEIGWSLLLLRQVGDALEIFEPDYDSMPIRWCRGVNNTVRHLQFQKSVCDLFGCHPQFPSIRHAGVVSPRFAESCVFTMSRDAPSASDSGWVFSEDESHKTEGNYCSLYQIALQKICIVPFLALPPSSQIRIQPGFVEISLNGITKSSDDTKLLRALADTSILV